MKQITLGIHVLVKKANKFLVLKRSNADKEDPGAWDLPGGGVRRTEDPFKAAIRETKEEAGIKIKDIKIVAARGMKTSKGLSFELLAKAVYASGTITLCKEHTENKWLSKTDLSKLKPRSIHLNYALKQKVW